MKKPKRISNYIISANLQLCERQQDKAVYMCCDFMAQVFRELLEHRKNARKRKHGATPQPLKTSDTFFTNRLPEPLTFMATEQDTAIRRYKKAKLARVHRKKSRHRAPKSTTSTKKRKKK